MRSASVLPIDQSLRCHDCGCVFVFSARDRVAFADRGWRVPRRCPTCRRGAERASAPA
ncbi:MAG: zinc-ribbon domain containing protein, partial [Acidobacteria bacterium]|nr:zinc-ribbon domain containing protein [Acidobacteriota bacterium]